MSETITIKDVKTILTQPAGSRLIVVKIITSEPGLYGLGCATFTQRFHAVHAAIEKHLKPFLIGRDIARIEDLWQMMMVNSYWRNGPVLNNAISGVDMALWDIQGKQAGMPVYQLLGGKCREAAAVYTHADGRNPQEVTARVREFMADGYRYIRIQMGGYGGQTGGMVKPQAHMHLLGTYKIEYLRGTLRAIIRPQKRFDEFKCRGLQGLVAITLKNLLDFCDKLTADILILGRIVLEPL